MIQRAITGADVTKASKKCVDGVWVGGPKNQEGLARMPLNPAPPPPNLNVGV